MSHCEDKMAAAKGLEQHTLQPACWVPVLILSTRHYAFALPFHVLYRLKCTEFSWSNESKNILSPFVSALKFKLCFFSQLYWLCLYSKSERLLSSAQAHLSVIEWFYTEDWILHLIVIEKDSCSHRLLCISFVLNAVRGQSDKKKEN